MATIYGFDKEWYSGKINQAMEGISNASEDAQADAFARLVSAAMLAQSIDNLADRVSKAASDTAVFMKD